MKRLSILLPEELCTKIWARSFREHDSGMSGTIRRILEEVFNKEESLVEKAVEQPLTEVPFKSIKESNQKIEEIEEATGSQCKAGDCFSKSQGYYKIVTGDDIQVKWLCNKHWLEAKIKGKVSQV